MTSLNVNDLMKMNAREVAGLADIDAYSVREEGFRRQTLAEKKLARLAKQMAMAKAVIEEAGLIITAAFKELAKQ